MKIEEFMEREGWKRTTMINHGAEYTFWRKGGFEIYEDDIGELEKSSEKKEMAK